MTTPQATLLGFAMWTLLVPLGAVGVYRWNRILRGVQSIHTFPADAVEGAGWYRRAMRAHANCVENLPVFAVVVWTLGVVGATGPTVDALCLVVLAARMGQSSVHMAFVESARTVSVRFSLYLLQVACMVALAVDVLAAHAPWQVS